MRGAGRGNGELRVIRAGRVPFVRGWDLQRELAVSGGSWLILLEHPPVFTVGRNGDPRNVIRAGDIPVVRIDRGGDVTYHGPGQLVGYPVLSLRERGMGIRDHVERMERAIIRVLGERGVRSVRREGFVGVWTGTGKIASIGVRVARGVTQHGFALNVDMDLTPFGAINPCGMPGCPITSMAAELGRPVPIGEVMDGVVEAVVAGYGFAGFRDEVFVARAGGSIVKYGV